LNPDELLTTTRAVRRRLDLERPVSPELLRECVEVALQAPAGGNVVAVTFVIVTDSALRREVGRIYGECFAAYRASDGYVGKLDAGGAAANAVQRRVAGSAEYLAERMGDAPALVIGCMRGRPDTPRRALGAAGSAMPAMWSFMLAAHARGLGTAWTTLHLAREREVADLLAIPFDDVSQFCLTPVAHTQGRGFRRASRPAADEVIHWDRWQGSGPDA
jgi:nitroreductase